MYQCQANVDDNTDLKNSINIMPNPAINNITFQVSTGLNLKKMILLNAVGIVIKEICLTSKNIDISNLPDGHYILLFFTDKGVFPKNIIKLNKN